MFFLSIESMYSMPKYMCYKINLIWCGDRFSSYWTKWSLEYTLVFGVGYRPTVLRVLLKTGILRTAWNMHTSGHTLFPEKKIFSKSLDHAGTICFSMAHNLTLEISLCNMQKYWSGTQINIKAQFCPYLTTTFLHCWLGTSVMETLDF